jgi:hypothetical protein
MSSTWNSPTYELMLATHSKQKDKKIITGGSRNKHEGLHDNKINEKKA